MNNRLSKAMRAYQKHMIRPSSTFINLGGADARDMSAYLIQDLLTDPRTALQSYTSSTYGPIYDFQLPDIGARWTQTGDFIGFLDP